MGFIRPPANQAPVQQQLVVSYQMTTRNRSFLEMHYYLKKKGIRNNAFMLALLDTDLAGIDPFDPQLSFAYKAKVHRECCRNFWYYLRECVRVIQTGNPQGVMFKLHRGNMAVYFMLLNNINTFFELPRQQGKTLAACVFYAWAYNFGTANTDIRFMHTKMQFAKDNLKMVKDIIGMLPTYLQMQQEYTILGDRKKKATSNVESMEQIVNHNRITVTASARSRSSAGTLLRGKTIGMLWFDEWGFIPYNDLIYVSTAPALRTAFNNARAAGRPYGVLMTTTPGVVSTDEGKYAKECREDCTLFTEYFYDKNPFELQRIIASNIKSSFCLVTFSWKQLGLSNEWLLEQCKEMHYSMPDIRREIFLEWILTTENCPFTPDELEEIEKYVNPPINQIELLGQYVLNVYKAIPLNSQYIPRHAPIIGVDVGGGMRRDYSAITIIDSLTTEVIADFQSNIISQIDLARLIHEIVTKLYPNAIVNIERNGGFGASVIAKLKESKVKGNLYYEIKDKIVEEKTDGLRTIRTKALTKVFGTDNTHDVREMLMEILRERVDLHKTKFNSQYILSDMKTLEVKRSGKIEHASNAHDDQIFSYLMALYVWYYGKNLRENFGIMKQSIKTDQGIDDTITSMDQEYTSVVEEILTDNTPEKQELGDQINRELAELKKGQGVLMDEFLKQRKEHEDSMHIAMLLRSKPAREAYAKSHNITVEQLNENLLHNGTFYVPVSVFSGFNSDLELDEEKERMKTLNLYNVPIEQ